MSNTIPERLHREINQRKVILQLLGDVEDQPLSDAEAEAQAIREIAAETAAAQRNSGKPADSMPPRPAPAAAARSRIEEDAAWVKAHLLTDLPPPPARVDNVPSWTSPAPAARPVRPPPRSAPPPDPVPAAPKHHVQLLYVVGARAADHQ